MPGRPLAGRKITWVAARPWEGETVIEDSHVWIRKARNARGLVQAEVAEALGISQTVYSKLETGRSTLSWARVAQLARFFKLPLQWALNGTERPGEDLAGISFELRFYGLSDLLVSGAQVPGAYRGFEEVIALAVGELRPDPRVIDAIPALLLRNTWSAHVLGGFAAAHHAEQRLAWLADVALVIADRLPRVAIQFVTRQNELHRVIRATNKPVASDSLGAPARAPDQLPVVSKRWSVTYDQTLDGFLARAKRLLGIEA